MNRASFKWLGGIIAIVGVMALMYWFIGSYVTLDWVQMHSRALRGAVAQHYTMSVLAFLAVVILSSLTSLPLVILLTILGGFLFGALFGAIYSLIGTAIGSTIGFLILRHFCAQRLRERYAVRFAPLFRQLEKYGSLYLIILYFLAVIPFFFINAFAALTPLSTRQFFLLTILGNLPLFLIYAFIGRSMSEITSVHDVFSTPVVIVFVLLLVIAVGSVMIKQHVLHHGEQEKQQ